jgi:hypothetical protein
MLFCGKLKSAVGKFNEDIFKLIYIVGNEVVYIGMSISGVLKSGKKLQYVVLYGRDYPQKVTRKTQSIIDY